MINCTCVCVYQHGATGKKAGELQIAVCDGPYAALRARSMPLLTLTAVSLPCD